MSTIQYTGPGGRVRLAGHDLLRQAAERLDPGLRLDPVEQVRVMNVPRGGTRAFRRARTRTHSGSGGQALARWFPELVGTTIDQELHRAVREQETVVYEIDSTVTASWVQVHAYPTTDGGLSVYGRDITERKEVEQLVGEAREAERGRIARALHDDALRGLSDAIALVAMRTGPRRSLGWPVSCCLFCGESVSSCVPPSTTYIPGVRSKGRLSSCSRGSWTSTRRWWAIARSSCRSGMAFPPDRSASRALRCCGFWVRR